MVFIIRFQKFLDSLDNNPDLAYTPQLMNVAMSPTFHLEQVGSADFVLLFVDDHSDLAGVDACMGSPHCRDH